MKAIARWCLGRAVFSRWPQYGKKLHFFIGYYASVIMVEEAVYFPEKDSPVSRGFSPGAPRREVAEQKFQKLPNLQREGPALVPDGGFLKIRGPILGAPVRRIINIYICIYTH